jgi:hypothetical protein
MAVQWRTRRSLGALAASLVTLALVVAPGAAAAPAANCQVWTGIPPPSPGALVNALTGVRALGPCNVWAVGFYQNVNDGQILSLAVHWNGTAWKVMPTPDPDPHGNVLSAVGAATINDAWAVGETGSNSFILHWNGSFWTQTPSPSPSSDNNDLSGVTVVSAIDAWAVGQYVPSTVANPLVLHWDGQSWTQTAVPAPGSQSVLEAVTAISASNAWAVGAFTPSGGQEKTLIEHWNGTKWVQVPSPNPPGTVSEIGLNGVTAISASDAWAVGTYTTGTMDKTLIEHWNGTAWKLVVSPNPEPRDDLNAVAATSAGNAWAVGFRGTSDTTLILRWNGTAWKVVPSPNPGQSSDLAGVAAPSATSVWAVGNYSVGGVTQALAAHCC